MHVGVRTAFSVALVAVALSAATAIGADVVLSGTPGNDTLNGTAAAEAIYGREGNDTLDGGAGDDDLDGGPGQDALSGGAGRDAASYSGGGVDVTIDGVANDGVAGEGDNVAADVEDLFGTESDDKLTGSAAANTIDGAGGADRIDGGAGQDELLGGEGPDTIAARDGELDRIECGGGSDTATVDLIDVVAADCESVAKPQVTIRPGLTLNARAGSKKIIISSIVSRSSVRLICVSCKPRKQKVIDAKSVSLSKGGVAVFRLAPQIRNQTIELGVRAPGSSPICVRYKVKGDYRYSTDRKTACTSAAKDV